MPDSNERDPLGNWLDQQVRPLPPPPGTFEMISARARRRKLRKLAVTLVSAAAVAAGVAIAVPAITSLHLSVPGESGAPVAASGGNRPASHPGLRGTQALNDGGAAAVSPSSSPAGPGPAAAPASGPAPGPVPADFEPVSVTFVSASRAWVIGQAGAPGHCYNGDICTSVAWTADGGATWHGEPAPVTGGPSGPDGVSGIRFLDGVNGWAFGPELWVTHDSGNTWQRLGTGGLRVTDLETAGDRAYAVFARCSGTAAQPFATDCTSYTLMTSLATSDTWTPVGPATSNLAGTPASSAMLALTGTAGYLAGPDGTLYSGPLGGTWTRAGTMPCQPGTAAANGQPATGAIALPGGSSLVTVCDGGPSATSPAVIYTSGDGGASWTMQPGSYWSGFSVPESSVTSLAAAVNGTLVLATTSGIYALPAGSSQWQAATASTASGMPSGGFSYVGMTTATQGVAIPENTSLHEIWLTRDGGLTWSPAPISG
jgi:hypothetical protein